MDVRNWSNLIVYLSTVDSCAPHMQSIQEYNKYIVQRGKMIMSREVCICRTDKA